MTRPGAGTLGALLALATLAVWLLLHPLPWPARAFATLLSAPLPALMILQARILDEIPEDTEREAVYISSATSIWILAALAMLAARFSDFTRISLRVVPLAPVELLLAAGATTLVGLGVMAAGRLLKVPDGALVDFLIPRTTTEKIAFAGLSVSAGIGEELVFRSFLIAALHAASGSLPLAVTAGVAVFALSHAYQGILGVVRVALLGLVLTAPFLLTGSVYPSIVAHVALDLIAGLVLADWLRGAPGDR